MDDKATPRPWRKIALGGASTIIAATKPGRNDTRIPPYGYKEENGHCIAYPFLDDDRDENEPRVRWDFVCFSHEDAALIVRAVNNFEPLAHVALAAQVVLNAAIEDYGAPDDYPEDDGAVGAGADSEMATTFLMIRNLRNALAAIEKDAG